LVGREEMLRALLTERTMITDVFVFDSATGSISQTSIYPGASLAFADSERPALSGDGRWIAFDSTAQLLPGAREPHRQVV
jgi:hypothetical protein